MQGVHVGFGEVDDTSRQRRVLWWSKLKSDVGVYEISMAAFCLPVLARPRASGMVIGHICACISLASRMTDLYYGRTKDGIAREGIDLRWT